MNSIDLYQLTRILNIDVFAIYERNLSARQEKLVVKPHEKDSLNVLVSTLIENNVSAEGLRSFYYSFEIPQIGKEFDLLRINKTSILNIELKCQEIQSDKIRKQMTQNVQYLSHLSRPISLFTFISSSKKVYMLDQKGDITECGIDTIVDYLNAQTGCFTGDINSLFRVSDYLVSPLNTPEKFMRTEYFLTSQQQENRNAIVKSIHAKTGGPLFCGITGAAGTGKTLALYDLARFCSDLGRVCVIHCGILSEGHQYLNDKLSNFDVIAAKNTGAIDFSLYKFIFVDESHRYYSNQFEELVKAIFANNLVCVFSYDQRQILSRKEGRRDIVGKIGDLPGFQEYKLSNKIRTNKEMASFIRRLFDLKHTDVQPNYPSISLIYANNEKEAGIFIREHRVRGYVFINYTQSQYNSGLFDKYDSDTDTHHVIGQEFDMVLMMIDSSFSYDQNDKLVAKAHPNPDYLFQKLLFQGLTRVRESLAIIVLDNPDIFSRILSILG